MVDALMLAAGAPERILVVDDEPSIRRLLVRLLKSGGYEVTSAPDGAAALALLDGVDPDALPDLILLDRTMPGLDGIGVCRAIQALGLGAQTPLVIFISALGTTQNQVDGLEAGAVDYVVKPFEPEAVRARVRAALRTKALRDVLAVQASTDALTGLANRRQLDDRASGALALAMRHDRPLSLLMIDMDHFKRVNDTLGHSAGDAVLRDVAARVQAQCRTVDVAARYGGEEFAVLLPETDGSGAFALAERIRSAVASVPIHVWRSDGSRGVDTIQMLVSIGAAVRTPDTTTPALLYERADAALYRAKETGRNRVVLAD